MLEVLKKKKKKKRIVFIIASVRQIYEQKHSLSA